MIGLLLLVCHPRASEDPSKDTVPKWIPHQVRDDKTRGGLILNPNRKAPITLSSTDMNRLAVKESRIASVYGGDMFLVEKDEQLGQMFLCLKPGIEPPEYLSMAFITEDGITQDLLVTFKSGVSKPVIFDSPKTPASRRQSAYRFFYSVLKGDEDQYVTQTRGESRVLPFATMLFQKRVLSKEFAVDFYEITGKNKRCIYNLSHHLFLSPGVLGVWLSDTKLSHPKNVIVGLLKSRSGCHPVLDTGSTILTQDGSRNKCGMTSRGSVKS